MFGKLSDNAIVEGIRLQDDKVLGYLYDNYYQMVKNHVTRNSGSSEDVSDVFQETIIAIYQKICGDDFILTSDLKGYFFGVARNIWNSQLRHNNLTDDLTVDVVDEDDEESSDPAFQRILSRSLEKLKPESREVLKLFYDGMSYEEIAVRMGYKNEVYARRKKYLSKEELIEVIRLDHEYSEYHGRL